MKTRILGGLIIAPLLILVYIGRLPLLIAVAVVAGLGMHELFQGFAACGIHANHKVAYTALAALFAIVLYVYLTMSEGMLKSPADQARLHILITAWFTASVMASCISIFRIDQHKMEDALATMLGLVYVTFFCFHAALVDMTAYGILVWMIFITAFCTDIFAYFTGYFLGKHKLCPVLSPKKTIEGAVGGVIGAMVCSLLFARLVCPDLTGHCLILGALGSVLSMCGDLTASAFKRKMGIKDYGHLIPGHGGILDRFDSVLFTAPVVYYYIMLVLR